MNVSKDEIARKGYCEGKYIPGEGKAHKCCKPHEEIFHCKMYGTFNVWLKTGKLSDFEPSIITGHRSYWFVKLTASKESWYGWVIRDHHSKQAMKTLEILSKEKFPDSLKTGTMAVNILERWNEDQIKEWAKDQYWFQGFLFAAQIRSDSERVWNAINQINWKGHTVLDIGAHTGYYSFKASELGAQVTAMEPNKLRLDEGIVIQEHIIQQDVKFTRTIPEGMFDTILYLSVHHQPDPNYKKLEGKIKQLRKKCKSHLFVELIMPPMFPKNNSLTEEQIDKIVGGKILDRYKHKVRGIRKIYWIAK